MTNYELLHIHINYLLKNVKVELSKVDLKKSTEESNIDDSLPQGVESLIINNFGDINGDMEIKCILRVRFEHTAEDLERVYVFAKICEAMGFKVTSHVEYIYQLLDPPIKTLDYAVKIIGLIDR